MTAARFTLSLQTRRVYRLRILIEEVNDKRRRFDPRIIQSGPNMIFSALNLPLALVMANDVRNTFA